MRVSEAEFLDDHELLDIGARVEIIIQGLRYAVLFKDIDTLRKCLIDLDENVKLLNDMIEGRFEQE